MNDLAEMETMPSRVNGSNGMMEVATTRAAQEVQAAVIMAKRFPRNTVDSRQRILDACKRPRLAEAAIYTYPRGGTNIEGPSIRLAETIAQCWGNIDSGVVELEQRDGESVMMSYALDWETNTRDSKVFTVKHIREKRGGNTRLTDPRDIYEMTANQAARRKRACILAIIPGDIVDDAIEQCNKTMAGKSEKPLADRVRDMAQAFGGMGVTGEAIERRLGTRLDALTEAHLVQLRKIFLSIRDNMGTVEDYFPPANSDAKPKGVDALAKKLKEKDAEAAVVRAVEGDSEADRIIREKTEQAHEIVKAKERPVSDHIPDTKEMVEPPTQSSESNLPESDEWKIALSNCRAAGSADKIAGMLHEWLAESASDQKDYEAEVLRIGAKGTKIVRIDDAQLLASKLALSLK